MIEVRCQGQQIGLLDWSLGALCLTFPSLVQPLLEKSNGAYLGYSLPHLLRLCIFFTVIIILDLPR